MENREKKKGDITTYEVIKALHQVANHSFDGVEYKKIGLKREEGNPLYDPRIIDSFGIAIFGKTLRIQYWCEESSKTVKDSANFEKDVEMYIEKVKKFLSKEYKEKTGDKLKLKSLMDAPYLDMSVYSVDGKKVRVTAFKDYEIGNYELLEEEYDEKAMMKKFLKYRDEEMKERISNFKEKPFMSYK